MSTLYWSEGDTRFFFGDKSRDGDDDERFLLFEKKKLIQLQILFSGRKSFSVAAVHQLVKTGFYFTRLLIESHPKASSDENTTQPDTKHHRRRRHQTQTDTHTHTHQPPPHQTISPTCICIVYCCHWERMQQHTPGQRSL